MKENFSLSRGILLNLMSLMVSIWLIGCNRITPANLPEAQALPAATIQSPAVQSTPTQAGVSPESQAAPADIKPAPKSSAILTPVNSSPDIQVTATETVLTQEAQSPAPTNPALSPTSDQASIDVASTIPFETIGRGETFIAELQSPALFVAASTAEVARFTTWLNDTNLVNRTQGIDFNRSWIVAVFSGPAPSTGYGVTIQTIDLTPEGVRLGVKLIEPDPDRLTSAVVSFPYDLILVSKDQLGVHPGATWAAYNSDGTLLAQVKYP
jgi:hypothetical protein